MERARPEPRDEDGLHVGGSPTRCPYCHDGIDVDAEAWVACATCLARHHQACWDEGGRCGACNGVERLKREGAAPAPARPRAGGQWLRPAGRQDHVHRSVLFDCPTSADLLRRYQGQVDVEQLLPWFAGELRRAMSDEGHVEYLANRLRWSPTPGRGCVMGRVQLAQGSQVELQVRLSWGGQLFGLVMGLVGGLGFGLAGGLGGVLLGALRLPPPAVVPMLVGWVAFVFVIGVLAARRMGRRQLARAERLIERLAKGLEGPATRDEKDPKA